MSAKWAIALFFLFVVALLPTPASRAEKSDVSISQASVGERERSLDMFITGYLDPRRLSCQISGQTAEIDGYAYLADSDACIRTTILVDVSEAVPPERREKTKSFLDTVIMQIGKNEQYKIVAVGDTVSVLNDFSADKFELAKSISELAFNATNNVIYDAINDSIPDVRPIGGSPCYHRIIVISADIDNTISDFTKDALHHKLSILPYPNAAPIIAIEIRSDQLTARDTEMRTLAQISGGKYFVLNAGVKITDLSSYLLVDDLFWIRARIPDALCDGLSRQVDIVDITDEDVALQFNIKMPVAVPQAPALTPTPSPTPSPSPSPTSVPVTTSGKVSTPSPKPGTTPTSSTPDPIGGVQTPMPTSETLDPSPTPIPKEPNVFVLALFGGAGVGVAITVTVISFNAIVQAKKKKKASRNRESEPTPNPMLKPMLKPEPLIQGVDTSLDATTGAFIDFTKYANCIRLRNVDVADQIWEIPFTDDIFIGRDESCQVCIAEISVARNQCKIYLDNAAYVENLSKTNITRLNGKILDAPAEIKTGDLIKCGRVTLAVDSLAIPDAGGAGDPSGKTVFINL